MMFEFVTTETCNSVSTIFNFNSAIFVCKNALKYTAILPNDISRIYLTPCAFVTTEPTFSVFLNFEVCLGPKEEMVYTVSILLLTIYLH